MKKLFQYTRRASQRRLLAFELARRNEPPPLPGDESRSAADDAAASTNVVEGKVLRGKISDAEYTAN